VIAGGEALTPPLRHGFPGKVHAAFTSDGRRLALSGDTERSVVWDLSPAGSEPAEMVAAAEVLTGEPLRGLLGSGKQAAEEWHLAWQRLRSRQPALFSTSREQMALPRLGAGDNPGYRATCTGLRERFGKSSDVYNANTLAWTCVLAPGGTDDPAWAIRLAEERVGSDPKGAGWTEPHLNTLGIAHYRAGNYREAIAWLDRAVEVRGQGGTPLDWLPLAMAHTRLGHQGEARKWLQKAVGELDRQTSSASDASAANSLPWTTRLEYQLFRREAEHVVNGTAPAMPDKGRDGKPPR
jgi:hypothetical protein